MIFLTMRNKTDFRISCNISPSLINNKKERSIVCIILSSIESQETEKD
jgi:hypothetical protein